MDERTDHHPITPALLSDEQAAHYCGVGRTLWRKMDRAGEVPRAIKLRGRVLWSRCSLDRWIEGGCKPRTEAAV